MMYQFLFFFSYAFSNEVLRLDNNQVESFIPFKHKYELIIEENCAHCHNQINILRSCVDEKDVVILMDNKSSKSEENLRKVLKKKKITYKTILLNKTLKENYADKGITPTLWITTPTSSESYAGVASCDFLKSKF